MAERLLLPAPAAAVGGAPPEVFSRRQLAGALKLDRLGLGFLAAPLMRWLDIERLNRTYARIAQAEGRQFLDTALEVLEIDYRVSARDLARVPRSGAFVALPNHPYGGIDGLILLHLLSGLRADFRVMANVHLRSMPVLASFLILVNQYRDLGTREVNVSGILRCLRHLRGGGSLGVFAAGAVAVRERLGGPLRDQPWHPTIGRIVARSGAAVLPVFFEGSNGRLFDLLGLVHPPLRRYLLSVELFRRAGSTVPVRIGPVVGPERIAACRDNDELMQLLYARTWELADPR